MLKPFRNKENLIIALFEISKFPLDKDSLQKKERGRKRFLCNGVEGGGGQKFCRNLLKKIFVCRKPCGTGLGSW